MHGVDDLNGEKRQLTKSLLARDFGLAIELPDDRLCPPVCESLSDSGYQEKGGAFMVSRSRIGTLTLLSDGGLPFANENGEG